MYQPNISWCVETLRSCGWSIALIQNGQRKYRVSKGEHTYIMGLKEIREFAQMTSAAPDSPAFRLITRR